MLAIVGGFVVFAAVAALVLQTLSDEDRRENLSGVVAIGLFFVYVVHADTVLTAAYVDVGRVPVPREVGFVVGGAVGLAGFVLFGLATRALVRHGDFQGLRSRRLVVEGPYRRLRHPQNTGWGLVLLGVAIAGRSLVALALVAVFVAFVARLDRYEARDLRTRFGPGYDAWRARTALP